MKYRYLGSSGMLVSRLCLGTMTFGAEGWGCNEDDSHRILARFLAAGGNFIDTADNYAATRSETYIGSYFASAGGRDQVVLSTKCFFPTSPAPASKGLSRKHIMEACEASLRRLQTDYIDLYYVHGYDKRVSWEIVMSALDDLVRQGKVRSLGCSNLYAWQFVRANGIARTHGRETFVAGQHMYNLVHREIEEEILPAADAEGMGIVAWSPLAGGLLTGKYRGGKSPQSGSRAAHRQAIDGPRFWHDRGFFATEGLHRICGETGADPVETAIGWVLRDRRVTSAIIGVKSVDQLEQNLGPGDTDINGELARRLSDELADRQAYPVQFEEHVDRSFYGAEEF